MNHPFKEILPEWVKYIVIVPSVGLGDSLCGASVYYHNNKRSARELMVEYNNLVGAMVFDRNRFIEGVSPVDISGVAEKTERPKQARYHSANTDVGAKDFIDETYENRPFSDFTAAMFWTIEKYMKRFGKKDDLVKEAYKIMDYATRFHEKVVLEEAKGKPCSPDELP